MSIVDELRLAHTELRYAASEDQRIPSIYTDAADEIERLRSEISRVVSERDQARAEVTALTSGGACVDGCCLPDGYTKTAAEYADNFARYKAQSAYAEQITAKASALLDALQPGEPLFAAYGMQAVDAYNALWALVEGKRTQTRNEIGRTEPRVKFGAEHCGDPMCELCCPEDLK